MYSKSNIKTFFFSPFKNKITGVKLVYPILSQINHQEKGKQSSWWFYPITHQGNFIETFLDLVSNDLDNLEYEENNKMHYSAAASPGRK